MSILGSGGNGKKSKTPLSDSGYTGHIIDRIMAELAEGTELNGHGRGQ